MEVSQTEESIDKAASFAKANLARIEKEKQEAAAREAQRKKEAAERAKQKEIEEINHDIEVSTDDTDF